MTADSGNGGWVPCGNCRVESKIVGDHLLARVPIKDVSAETCGLTKQGVSVKVGTTGPPQPAGRGLMLAMTVYAPLPEDKISEEAKVAREARKAARKG